MARKSRKIVACDAQINHHIMPEEKIWNAAIYIRLSVEDIKYKKGSDSLTNQQYMLEQYILERSDLRLCNVYSDNGESGTDFDRPAFNRLMEDIKKGMVDCIIVKDLSRFGRNYIEAGTYLEKIFPFLGVRFISVGDQYDTADPDCDRGELVVSLKNLMNDAYAKDISKKILSSLEIKQRKGDFIGPFPIYGYMKSQENKHKLVVDPQTAPTVKNIFKWKLDGLSHVRIVRRLNDRSVPCPSRHLYEKGIIKQERCANMLWNLSAIKHILQSRFYLGHMIQGRSKQSLFEGKDSETLPESEWIVVENTHEAIIDQETFDAVQDLINERNQKHKQKLGKYDDLGKCTNIFRGIVICGDCKKALTWCKEVSGKPKKVSYKFICPTYAVHKDRLCSKKRIREDELKEAVYAAIEEQILFAADIEKLTEKMQNAVPVKKRYEAIELEINTLNKKLSKFPSLKGALYEDFAGHLLTEGAYRFTRQKYEDDMVASQQRLGFLTQEKIKCEKNFLTDNKWIRAIRKFQNEKELTGKMVQILIDKVEVYSDKRISIQFRFKDELENLLRYISDGEMQDDSDHSILQSEMPCHKAMPEVASE